LNSQNECHIHIDILVLCISLILGWDNNQSGSKSKNKKRCAIFIIIRVFNYHLTLICVYDKKEKSNQRSCCIYKKNRWYVSDIFIKKKNVKIHLYSDLKK
jgi:hypothetical protein